MENITVPGDSLIQNAVRFWEMSPEYFAVVIFPAPTVIPPSASPRPRWHRSSQAAQCTRIIGWRTDCY
jgi:hypothetical protein